MKAAGRKEGRKGKYVIVRTYSASVFAGEFQSKDRCGWVVLTNARRIWRWAGAATLSQLAMEGVSKPLECKFPCEVTRIQIPHVEEIIDATEAARKSIKAVPIWKE